MTLLPDRDKLQTFYFMRQAIREADQHASAIKRDGIASARAARTLLAAAEKLEDFRQHRFAAVSILHQAIAFAADGLARRKQLVSQDARLTEIWSRLLELPEVAQSISALSAPSRELVKETVMQDVPLVHGDWSDSELQTIEQTLFAVLRQLTTWLEDDIAAPLRLRARRVLRWISSGLVVLLLSVVATAFVLRTKEQGTTNLALNATVTTSSNYDANTYPPSGLVDGNTAALGCHTQGEEH
ncbi:MAG TPA: hypothetical protein VIV60_05340, partial [Polyangiaceae bacterium]